MCLLLETIKLEDGRLFNLDYHNRRMNAARSELFPGCAPINLHKAIAIPDDCRKGLYRCRIVYTETIQKIEFISQTPRTFTRLKVVTHNTIDYHLKFADRSILNELLAQRGDADEIIIVKNGEVTDCSIGNLVLFDGSKWVTPENPLLRGTQRQKLLDEGKIEAKIIRLEELHSYPKIGIINAFYNLQNMPVINAGNIS